MSTDIPPRKPPSGLALDQPPQEYLRLAVTLLLDRLQPGILDMSEARAAVLRLMARNDLLNPGALDMFEAVRRGMELEKTTGHRGTPVDEDLESLLNLLGAAHRRGLELGKALPPAGEERMPVWGATAVLSTPDGLNPTDLKILKVVKRKALKGESIALKIDREYDYVRRRLAYLVKIRKLRKTDNGYRCNV